MDKPVKILSLVPYKILPPDMGGQKGIAFFNRYLSRHANLCCVTTKNNGPDINEEYPIKNILSNGSGRYFNPFYFFTICRIIKEEKITHLIIEHPYFGWLGVLLKWFCKVKLIVHSHNIEALRFKSIGKWWWRFLWHYEKFTHRQANHNFFIQKSDKDYAVTNFKLLTDACSTITYGFEHSKVPSSEEKNIARKLICKTHDIPETTRLLLFNGTLGYKPNLDALDTILYKINPLLLSATGFTYKIIICGSKLPSSYSGLTDYKEKNIVYAGFVDDINVYFKGSDIFINPVTSGGGIKTKLVEALGYNLSVISTKSGAIGFDEEIAGEKLNIVEDNDWITFASSIVTMNTKIQTSPAFFENFYWDNIAKKAEAVLNR